MKKPPTPQVAQRIKQIMKWSGITQKGLADYLNISQPAISLYLQGRVPPADVLLKIAKLGNTTVEWILTGETGPSGKTIQIKEERITYGSEIVLYELWRQLPENLRQAFLNLLKHVVEHSKK